MFASGLAIKQPTSVQAKMQGILTKLAMISASQVQRMLITPIALITIAFRAILPVEIKLMPLAAARALGPSQIERWTITQLV